MFSEGKIMPQAFILAGPNGAGKSTLSTRFVPRGVPFLNADDIAREIAQPGRSADIAAGRLLLARLDEVEQARIDFAVETNLANRTLALRIPRWREAGFEVLLYFVWVPSAEIAVERVAQRVRSGGHNIPEATIRRRYRVGLRMFFDVYQPLVDVWRVYDNSGEGRPSVIAKGRVRRRETWDSIVQEVRNGDTGGEGDRSL